MNRRRRCDWIIFCIFSHIFVLMSTYLCLISYPITPANVNTSNLFACAMPSQQTLETKYCVKSISPMVQKDPAGRLLAVMMQHSSSLPWASFTFLLHSYNCGVVKGFHDSSQAAAQVVRLVDMDLWWIFKHHSAGGTVQNPGKQLTQLDLQCICKKNNGQAAEIRTTVFTV